MSLIKDILVTAPEAQGIKCPYTGKPLDIYMRISAGIVTFSAPEALSLAIPWPSVADLREAAAMRDGSPAEGPGSVCAYTGAPIEVVETEDGQYYMKGAFNPRRSYLSLQKLLKDLSRGAVVTEAPPTAETIPEIQTELDEDQKFEIPQEAHERTERAAQQFVRSTGIDTSVSVSMAGGSRKSRRRGRSK